MEERLPAILDAFRAGDLDYQRVRTIALVLSKASDNTVRGIEADVLASARRCSIRRLRERIWAHWFDYNEAEALAARKATESEEPCASIKHGADGMATLFAKMTALEGVECNSVLDEIAGTVMVPGNGVPARKNKRTRTPRPTAPTGDPPDELYAPTWWETYIGEYSEYGDVADTDRAAYVPSLGDIARLTDPTARADAIFLRERFLEHRAVVTARERYRPPPF
ncbi:hypothetical protein CH289_13210 [Rhodococcus sp. RS1C4]|nr:DUF222 domain-containing protein [Rhodococcus sp. RS1C4]OZC52060.1 hypothetical protein CH289_13210 [Rhodococcus sp. RS1C4]